MTPLTMIRAIPLAALLLSAAPAVAHAQRLGPPPTIAQCGEWKAGLAAGGARALYALDHGWPAGCADAPGILVPALRSARLVSDVDYLYALTVQAADVRDASIFAAALALAEDSGATTKARAAAVLVTIAQLGSSIDFHQLSRGALLTDPLPATGLCGPRIAGSHGPIERTPLPSDAERRAARVIDRLTYGAGTPALLRNLARCSRTGFGADIPPQVDLGGVSLEYVCGTTFRIHNPTPVRLVFAYRVEGFSDQFDIPVEASRHEDFDVFRRGRCDSCTTDGR
jgi:hypothetical protein